MAKAPTRNSSVLDSQGNPIKVSTLSQEQAPPTITGVRSPWADAVAPGLDPVKLARLLKSANEGENQEFLALAEEMEERDPHYASVLGQRKRAVSGIDAIVTPASKSAQDQEIADAVEDLVATPEFSELVDDLLDGIAKGYSAAQILWNTTADLWTPAKYEHRDPRHFQFDKKTGKELRIRDDDNEDGLELRPHCWVVHRPKLKSGLPVRGGLARVVAWVFMLKTFTLQDWAAFLEVFGMPLRLGRYDDSSSAEEKRVLLRAVRDLGSDAAAIIPKGMEVEFIEAKGGTGNAAFGAMADYLDKQTSKAVIGQTMTTDEGSSKSQSETHDEVRGDIKKADAKQLAATIKRDIIEPFVGFNWGWGAAVPDLSFPVEDAEDVEALTNAVVNLVPLGLRVAMADVSKRLGFRVPDDGEEILRIASAAQSDPGTSLQDPARAHAVNCPSCGGTHRASAHSDEDELISDAIGSWEADVGPVLASIMTAAHAASSYEEFQEALDQINPDMSAMAERLAPLLMIARGEGDLDA
ncbi:Mu-like prophage protein gp29 [Aliiroseovarius crassostreae]|uniref:DUF935 domain-containing protein n=1 Tax=Aliiroseovarius crassostreae TaxID=154981 RepID=A0A0P7I4M9_9RHOB|nr:DUF935 domain-containing protein [Aliiroseovarius crassostreae]KPN64263.1 hypothetical protein AKJ29_16650 [Aliiroseovarius crassostreae]SFU31252.1 Mu-like prophage protein gp29 [Aliiroseovarius crassostreae]